jgi:nicotinate-nucleotide pyrophosphorylase (carboxylating)
MEDIRDLLFQPIQDKRFRAVLTAERAGVLSGTEAAYEQAEALGIELDLCKKEGEALGHLERIGHLEGSPKQLAQAEERIIGTLAKASGIATAANTAVTLADGKIDIVCGSCKKMPPELKPLVRRAVLAGGASLRIAEPPMLYLDKNFIRMFGSISAAIDASAPFGGYNRVVQIKGIDRAIDEEAREALSNGCDVLMIDTGSLEELDRCAGIVRETGLRDKVRIAFAKGIKLTDIPELCLHDIDALCIGAEIVDAPLLDIRLDVIGEA